MTQTEMDSDIYAYNNKCPLPFSEPTTCGELEKAYKQGRADALEEVRAYFNSFNPTNINVDMETWQMGINNYINRMIKEQKNEKKA